METLEGLEQDKKKKKKKCSGEKNKQYREGPDPTQCIPLPPPSQWNSAGIVLGSWRNRRILGGIAVLEN